MAFIIIFQCYFLFSSLIFLWKYFYHTTMNAHIGQITWSLLKVILVLVLSLLIITLTVILCKQCMISSSHKSKDPQILHESSLLKSELAVTDEGFLWFTYNPICTKGLRFSLEARRKPISPVQNLLISTLWWISCHVA